MSTITRRLPAVCGMMFIAMGLANFKVSSSETTPSTGLRPWDEYRTIMWTGDTAYQDPKRLPLYFQRLREMGINTGMVHGDGDLGPLGESKFPYYVENMVNKGLCLKFNSNVRDWDKFVTEWVKGGRQESALVRDYCLDGDEWRNGARKQMQDLVRKNSANLPIAYDIRDELSTTISANPFDYDFNPITLGKFHQWLRTRYSNLEALNTEWDTKFVNWDEIRPFTTDQIKNRMASGDAQPRGKPDWQALQGLKFEVAAARQNRTRWNFSPWADFRSYMDFSLAQALDFLRQSAHELDAVTPVGIEGTQMPNAFGGYDLWRLSQVLDWIEPYDIGCAREILGSFMPDKPLLTTVFEGDSEHARRRLWHLLLEGDRGCIVWWSEDCIDWKSADYALTAKGRALAPVLKEMTSPLARVFLRAQREYDSIFIHYSQPSIQVDWLLESTVDGSTWLRRFSSFEADHNRQAWARDAWLKAFQDLGWSPQFISAEQIELGGLRKLGAATLVLPTSRALSDKEGAEISSFLSYGQDKEIKREVFTDGLPGVFDEHGRLRDVSPLERFFPSPSVPPEEGSLVALGNSAPQKMLLGDVANYAAERLHLDARSKWLERLAEPMRSKRPEVFVPASAHVRVHRFRSGQSQLLALERNVDYHMSEDLKQAGGNEALEKAIEFEVSFSRPRHVYELRQQKYLGLMSQLPVKLDPWQPSLFALTEAKVPEDKIIERLDRESVK